MQKHPKDVRIGDESKYEDDVKAEVVVKKSTGIVEEQFLENMKNYNNLKDALTSLSSNIDQVANDRSHEVKCDNSVSDSTKCKAAPATPKLMNKKKEAESSGWLSSLWSYLG